MIASFQSNVFTQEFGLKFPIAQGPMGGVAGPELIAAVAEAGGLGMLPIWNLPLGMATQSISRTQALTQAAFAVNLRADLVQVDHISASLDAGVSLIHLFWGDPAAAMSYIAPGDAKVMVTIGDADAAKAALDAGADLLIAQGIEAGGHVLGDVPLKKLLETVLPIAAGVPVLAAGGLATAVDVAEVMVAGACGALLGTRFVATRESLAHDSYKQALLEAGAGATARSVCFDGGWEQAPHRTLRNSTYELWQAAGAPPQGARPGEGDVIMKRQETPIFRYSAIPPARGMTGECLAAAMYAGTGVDRVGDCPTAAEVIQVLVSRLSPSA